VPEPHLDVRRESGHRAADALACDKTFDGSVLADETGHLVGEAEGDLPRWTSLEMRPRRETLLREFGIGGPSDLDPARMVPAGGPDRCRGHSRDHARGRQLVHLADDRAAGDEGATADDRPAVDRRVHADEIVDIDLA